MASGKPHCVTDHGGQADASEPTTEGHNKFHVVSKGHKHTFKAGSTAERDSWVSQLNLKIAEAKTLAEGIKESETYKSTLASLKPAPPAKKEEPAKEAPKEAVKDAVAVPAAEEAKKDEPTKEEETKRRSASRKRGSIFGNLNILGKKDEKKEEKAADKPAEAVVADAPAEVAATEAATEAAPAEVPAAVEAEPAEAKATETKEVKETKPTPTKRTR